jgi:hypothetical protein
MKQKFTTNFLLASILCVGLSAGTALAQDKPAESKSSDGKNMIKINLPALAVSNFSFQYERAIGAKTSVGLGLRIRPEGDLPFKSFLEKSIDDQETWDSFKETQLSSFAISPEIKFYFGKSVFHGFYVAPFVTYATYGGNVTALYGTNNESKLPLKGDITAITGGVKLGGQWALTKSIYLDLFFGPNYGVSSGSLAGSKSLTASEQQEVEDFLEDLEDLPLVKIKYDVDGNGAKADFDGPWGGLRAGLSVGFRF